MQSKDPIQQALEDQLKSAQEAGNTEELESIANDAESIFEEDIAAKAREAITQIESQKTEAEQVVEEKVPEVEELGGTSEELHERVEPVQEEMEEVVDWALGVIGEASLGTESAIEGETKSPTETFTQQVKEYRERSLLEDQEKQNITIEEFKSLGENINSIFVEKPEMLDYFSEMKEQGLIPDNFFDTIKLPEVTRENFDQLHAFVSHAPKDFFESTQGKMTSSIMENMYVQKINEGLGQEGNPTKLFEYAALAGKITNTDGLQSHLDKKLETLISNDKQMEHLVGKNGENIKHFFESGHGDIAKKMIERLLVEDRPHAKRLDLQISNYVDKGFISQEEFEKMLSDRKVSLLESLNKEKSRSLEDQENMKKHLEHWSGNKAYLEKMIETTPPGDTVTLGDLSGIARDVFPKAQDLVTTNLAEIQERQDELKERIEEQQEKIDAIKNGEVI